jgi:hypothetical protein
VSVASARTKGAAPRARTKPTWSTAWLWCGAARVTELVTTSSGTADFAASTIALLAWVNPGPCVTVATPTCPVTRAKLSAAATAADS